MSNQSNHLRWFNQIGAVINSMEPMDVDGPRDLLNMLGSKLPLSSYGRDGHHQPFFCRGFYTHYKDIIRIPVIKGRMTMSNIRSRSTLAHIFSHICCDVVLILLLKLVILLFFPGLPKTLNAEILLSLLDDRFLGCYDYFYLPMATRKHQPGLLVVFHGPTPTLKQELQPK